MKVNTDGVLLGAAVSLCPDDSRILDAGTGTGVIALMVAQRLSCLHEDGAAEDIGGAESGSRDPFSITGIDIDKAAALEAGLNFERSPWKDSLEALHCALRDYVPEAPLDLIVSNPPYFQNSLLPREQGRVLARHSEGEALDFTGLASFAAANLRPGGRLSVILPAGLETGVRRYAASRGLYLTRILRIRTTPRKPFTRNILEFRLQDGPSPLPVSESELTIMDPPAFPDNKNGYTRDYLDLTGDFYL